MAFTTPNMALTVWNALSDPYDHEQLAANFLKLDQHRHVSGEGEQIPTGGLLDGAVTQAKILAPTVVAATLTGWTSSTVSYWKDSLGYVGIDGTATADGSTTNIVTLPSGSRPTVTVRIPVTNASATFGTYIVVINTSGVVTVTGTTGSAVPNATVVSFGPVRFRTF